MQPCRKCLLSESSDIYSTILDYVKSIPPEQKTTFVEYERRLVICKSCDHLVNGMCILCGCYVEVRAAKTNQHCTKSENIW